MPATLFLYPENDTIGALRKWHEQLQECGFPPNTPISDGPPTIPSLKTLKDVTRWLGKNTHKKDQQTIPYIVLETKNGS